MLGGAQGHWNGPVLLVGRETHPHLAAGLLQDPDRRHGATQRVQIGVARSGPHQAAHLGQFVGELVTGRLSAALDRQVLVGLRPLSCVIVRRRTVQFDAPRPLAVVNAQHVMVPGEARLHSRGGLGV